MCSCLDIGTSSFYEHRGSSQKSEKDQAIERRVIGIFKEHKRRYGTRRIVSQLQDEGTWTGREKVHGIMKKYGLMAIQPKSYVPRTTQSDKR